MQEVVGNEANGAANVPQVPSVAADTAAVEEKRLAIPVDPSIAAIIKSANRPVGVPKLVRPPEDIPGRLGLVRGMQLVIGSLRRGIATAEDGRNRHGDIYRDTFLDKHAVVIWDADEIQKIVRNESQAWSAAMGWDVAMFEGLDRRGGNIGTILSVDFEDHKVARALVQPAFTMKAIQGYLNIAKRSFDEVVPSWVASKHVKFKPTARTLLARVANDIFTGISDPEQVRHIDRALVQFWKGMMALSRNAWISPTYRGSRRGFETLRSTFLALVPERRKTGGNDLFSHLCKGAEGAGAPAADDETMVRLFMSIMFAAFDTTSAAVTSMAYLLAKNPEWQERVRTEALALSGPLDAANLRSLKELEWCWKETLRLMPVAGFIPRRALREIKVGDYTLPAGTTAFPMVGGIGRHPKWWKEPHRFDPLRFSPERAEDKQHPALSMPFGAGAHSCIGTQLAGFEMKLLFHAMLTSCRWSLAKDYEANHTFTPMGCVSGDVALRLEPL